jgi:exonuclease SbcC
LLIKRVELKNILSHENTAVEFPYGITAIIGPNGAGKSSIVDSIYIALLAGRVIDVRGEKKEYIIMRGRGSGEISVEFEIGGHQYLVTRKLYKSLPADAYLYKIEGGAKKLIAEKVEGVTVTIPKLIGFTGLKDSDVRDIVRSTIFALQGELTKIVDIGKAERKEYILTLLGLNYLEEALKNLKSITKQKESLKELYKSLEGSLNTLKSTINELMQVRDSLKNALPSLESEVKKLETEINNVNKRIQSIDTYIDCAKKLEVAIAYREMKRLEEEIARLEEAHRTWESEGREIQSLIKEIDGFKSRIQKVRQSINEVLDKLSKALNISVDSVDKVASIKSAKKAEVEKLSRELENFKARKSLYQVYIESFEASGTCPLCGSPIRDPGVFRSHIAEEISKVDAEIKRLSDEINKLSTEALELDKYEKQLSNLQAVYQSLTEYLQDKEAEVAKASERILSICRKYSNSVNNVSECIDMLKSLSKMYEDFEMQLLHYRRVYGGLAPPAEDIDTIVKRLRDVEGLGIQIPAKLDTTSVRQLIDSIEKVRSTLDKRYRELTTALTNKKSELEGKRAQVENIEKQLKDFSEKVKQVEEELKKIGKTIEAYNIIEQFAEKYLGKGGVLAKELTKFVRTELEKRTNTILSRLGLREITINEDFEIFIKIGSDVVPLDNASGGERVAIAIAMRLALAELAMGRTPTVLILDEPTVYLDDERRVEIFSILGELGKSLKQVIIVTHDEKVIDIADAVIRVENIGNVSRVTRER